MKWVNFAANMTIFVYAGHEWSKPDGAWYDLVGMIAWGLIALIELDEDLTDEEVD